MLPDINKHVHSVAWKNKLCLRQDGCNACMMDVMPSLKRKWKIEGEKQKH